MCFLCTMDDICFFELLTCCHLFSLNIPHIQAVPNPVCLHVSSSLLSYCNPNSDYQCHFPYLYRGFLTGPLFFLTPIPFLCSYQINLKIQLWSGSQPISVSALPNEKILHFFWVLLKANISVSNYFSQFYQSCSTHAATDMCDNTLLYFPKGSFSLLYLLQSWKQWHFPSLFTPIL